MSSTASMLCTASAIVWAVSNCHRQYVGSQRHAMPAAQQPHLVRQQWSVEAAGVDDVCWSSSKPTQHCSHIPDTSPYRHEPQFSLSSSGQEY